VPGLPVKAAGHATKITWRTLVLVRKVQVRLGSTKQQGMTQQQR
jgi:hypothetical protein